MALLFKPIRSDPFLPLELVPTLSSSSIAVLTSSSAFFWLRFVGNLRAFSVFVTPSCLRAGPDLVKIQFTAGLAAPTIAPVSNDWLAGSPCACLLAAVSSPCPVALTNPRVRLREFLMALISASALAALLATCPAGISPPLEATMPESLFMLLISGASIRALAPMPSFSTLSPGINIPTRLPSLPDTLSPSEGVA